MLPPPPLAFCSSKKMGRCRHGKAHPKEAFNGIVTMAKCCQKRGGVKGCILLPLGGILGQPPQRATTQRIGCPWLARPRGTCGLADLPPCNWTGPLNLVWVPVLMILEAPFDCFLKKRSKSVHCNSSNILPPLFVFLHHWPGGISPLAVAHTTCCIDFNV